MTALASARKNIYLILIASFFDRSFNVEAQTKSEKQLLSD